MPYYCYLATFSVPLWLSPLLAHPLYHHPVSFLPYLLSPTHLPRTGLLFLLSYLSFSYRDSCRSFSHVPLYLHPSQILPPQASVFGLYRPLSSCFFQASRISLLLSHCSPSGTLHICLFPPLAWCCRMTGDHLHIAYPVHYLYQMFP